MWCDEKFQLGPDPYFESSSGKACDDARRVGTWLGRYRQELLEIGTHLSRVLGPDGADTIDKSVQVLDKQVCRIAVIGQIKAGKSTFINAFVQRPQLLPTGVNPWTTTVTNLHFRAAHDCKDAAVFHFFSEPEWEQLANGQGKLRELTENLVPGFKPELLRWYVSALQTRAATRLGPNSPLCSVDTIAHRRCLRTFFSSTSARAIPPPSRWRAIRSGAIPTSPSRRTSICPRDPSTIR